jgi:hypothetical protein
MRLALLLSCLILLTSCATPSSQQHLEFVLDKTYDYRSFNLNNQTVVSLFGPGGEHLFTAVTPMATPVDSASSIAIKYLVPAASALGIVK